MSLWRSADSVRFRSSIATRKSSRERRNASVAFFCAETMNATMSDVMQNTIKRGACEISTASRSCFHIDEMIGGAML